MDPQAPPAEPKGLALLEVMQRLGLLAPRLAARLADAAAGASTEELLLAEHVLSREALEDLLAFQDELASGQPLGRLVHRELLSCLPEAFALKHRLLPLRVIGDHLVVAHPEAGEAPEALLRSLDEGALRCGKPLLGWPVEAAVWERTSTDFYNPHSAAKAIHRALTEGEVVGTEPPEAEAAEGDGPIVDLANDLLQRAHSLGASDLHLAPAQEGLRVRLRIDGVLADQLLVPPTLQSALVTRIKLLAGLNISERRHPQDGRFTWRHRGQEVDLRVATTPTRWGEMVVMRLLKGLSVVGDLAALGLSAGALAVYRRMVTAPHGIVLVTGPTGSGKSTTLYGTLMAQDRVGQNVISIEDPVEFGIEGVMQIQVHAAIGMTFATALRSVLRLDPDTIFVGEIRDAETMDIAMHSAMTGHLVLSTLHANSALATLGRMRELGAELVDLVHALRGVVAQRLVRRLCDRCKRPLRASDPAAAWAAKRPEGLGPYWAPQGCVACHETGYKGRLGLFEVLSVDEGLAAWLLATQQPSLQGLRQVSSMVPLVEDGIAKAAQGLTTLAEVDRVARLP